MGEATRVSIFSHAFRRIAYWVCITWIFFRAALTYNYKTHVVEVTALDNAWDALKAFTFISKHGRTGFGISCFRILALLALIHWLNFRRVLHERWRRLPDWAAAVLLGAGVALALLFVPVKYKPFIYFQF